MNSTKHSEYRNVVKEWLKSSKVHGFDRLVTSENWILKFIWLAGLVVSASLCTYLNANMIMSYFEYDVKTTIREVYTEQVPFPRVSICNFNPLVTPEASAYIRNYFMVNFNVNIIEYSDFYLYNNSDLLTTELAYLFYMTNDPAFNSTLRETFGYNFLLLCSYYDNPCKSEDVISYYDLLNGNCYLVNSNKYANGSAREIFETYEQDSGLSLVMFVGPPQSDSLLYDPTYGQIGLMIQVEEPDYSGLFVEGIGIPPGMQANIVITRTETHNMATPYSDCTPSSAINTLASQQMKQLDMTYSRQSCLPICKQNQIIEQVGCNYLQLPIIPGYPLCTNKTQYLAANLVQANKVVCNELCPIECDLVTYQTSVSYTDWPTWATYYSALKTGKTSMALGSYNLSNMSYDQVTSSFARAVLFYNEIKYTEIMETPNMSIFDLIAAIGGMMGLFLGFSIMIYIELVELVLQIAFLCVKNRFKNIWLSKIKPTNNAI